MILFVGVFEGSGVQTSPHQLGRAQGQDQKGDEGAARYPGQKGSFYHREEGSQSNVCKWKAFCVENSD